MASIEWKGKLTMTNEEIISGFLQTAYTDERLAMLLAHAEDGKLSFFSCCCVAGIPTAEHALRGRTDDWSEHGKTYGDIPGGDVVSKAFNNLATSFAFDRWDAERRSALIPLIHAEMQRREFLRAQQVEVPEMVTV